MHRRPLVFLTSLALAVPAAFLAVPVASAAPVSAPAKPYDFNGDGRPDVAVGAPFLKVGKYAEGGIASLNASSTGYAAKARVLAPGSPGVATPVSADDEFGYSLASGDFDRDGYADLAVGVLVAYRRYEGAGAVTILYGSAAGLTGDRSVELLEPEGPQFDTGFGRVLAAGDFDGDGFADLAASSPDDYRSDDDGSGVVAVFRGAAGGLAESRSTVLRGKPGAFGEDKDDLFGDTLAVGDVDGDSRPDLVVGAGSGSVSACYGAAAPLTSCVRLAASPALAGGSALAVGNVSGSSRPEIVLGGVGISDGDRAGGRIETLSLSGSRGATTVSRAELTEDSPGVRGTAEKGDRFGASLALGDLDGDGFADLVVGAPGEDKGRGRVTVVFGGGPNGYRTTGGLVYDQDTKGVPGAAEKKDAFGEQVALLDRDGSGTFDLAVGAPGENGDDGAVSLLRGAGGAFTGKGSRTVSLEDLGYSAGKDAAFGASLGR